MIGPVSALRSVSAISRQRPYKLRRVAAAMQPNSQCGLLLGSALAAVEAAAGKMQKTA